MALRRTQLAMRYWLSLQGNKLNHPTTETLKPYLEKEQDMRSFWVDNQ